MRKNATYFLILIAIIIQGCTSYNSLLSFDGTPGIPTSPQQISNYAPLKIQTNDILRIRISSIDPTALQPFIASAGDGTTGNSYEEYLVNSDGFIQFPTIGKILVKGLVAEEAGNRISEKLSTYFKEQPIVEVRLANFKVNINGEVGRPGILNVTNERLTLIEALTLAGDFTSYSRRDSILIIREENGMREFGYVDFNNTDFFNSKYFFLQQNDVVYVQPDKAKVNTVSDPVSRFLPWVSAIVSISALIITVTR